MCPHDLVATDERIDCSHPPTTPLLQHCGDWNDRYSEPVLCSNQRTQSIHPNPTFIGPAIAVSRHSLGLSLAFSCRPSSCSAHCRLPNGLTCRKTGPCSCVSG